MRYFIFIMLVALLFVGCEDDPTQSHTNVVSCTKDDDCKGNTNGKLLCIDDKCTEPAQVEDCSTDDDCKDNTTNTKCIEAKCVKPDVVNCSTDDNCKENSNGKTICTDNKCTEPVQVEDCNSDDDCKDNIVNTVCTDNKCAEPETNTDDCTADTNCANNDNGKTVCNELKCVEPNAVDCTDGGNECANNFNGKIVCNELRCVEPNAVDCTDGGNECTNNFDGKVVCNVAELKCAAPNAEICTDGGNECTENFNGKVVCNTITFECVEPNAVDCTDGGDECIENFDGNTVCDIETGKCVHVDAVECTDGGNECAQNRDGKTKCSTLFLCVDPACVPVEETCNGIDDNCDGQIDNGDLCTGYTNGIGQCIPKEDGTAVCGLLSCNENFYNNDNDESNGCEYACTPIVGGEELCNGIDDNCDGQVDEGFNLQEDPNNCGACNTVCGTYANAATVCVAGQCEMGGCDGGSYDQNNDDSDGCEYACNFEGEEDSDCNGEDNDCDGTADEDADLTAVENCGACGNNCEDAVEPAYQRTLFITCNGSCQYTCDSGRYNIDNDWSNGCEYSCTPTNGGVEKCDGLDNDCNGQNDDGITCNCTDGASESCDVANTNTCHSTRMCVSGNWETCTLNDYNHAETCDGLDNDCDGPVDEDFMTGDIYTDDNNCGECGKVCQDVHSRNYCIKTGASAGTCNPLCSSGWTNFNANNFDGCETGCSVHSFGSPTYYYKKVAGGASGNDTEYADSIYADGKLAIIYTKNANPRNIYAKIVNKDGSDAVAEKVLTDLAANKYASRPSITKVGNYYHISYYSNEDGNYDIYHRIYDRNLNVVTGKPRINVSNGSDNAYIPYLAKENYISGTLPLVWYEYNAGHTNIHYRTINTSTNTLNNDEYTLTKWYWTGSSVAYYNLYYPKITTTASGVAFTFCKRISSTKSELYLAKMKKDHTDYSEVNLSTYSDGYCNSGLEKVGITSDNYYIYVTFIDKADDLHVQRRSRTSLGIYGTEYKKVGTYKRASISYSGYNVVVATSRKVQYSSYYRTYVDSYRFDRYLRLKNINYAFRNLKDSTLQSYINVFYTEDKKVLTQYSTNYTSAGTDIEISITDTCGN